jgi:uncharacterized protein with PIN domain
MSQVWFRFYEELNDFLPASRKKQLFSHSFNGNPSVKDVIESLGVPHVEVDMILVNGKSVDFSCRLSDEDHVSVYPVFESMDISEVQHLRAEPLRDIRFIADVHLGRLAKYLRLLGFDTAFDRDLEDSKIISISLSQNRIILTRDKGILKNSRITHGYWIRSSDPRKQIIEVSGRFDLKRLFKPFTRCLECNTLIVDVPKEEITEKLLPKTRKYYNHFQICPDCGRIYWEGSHYDRMKQFVESLLPPEKNNIFE